MRTLNLTFLFSIFCFSQFTFAQPIQELWSVPALSTYVLVGAEQMDLDPAKELVYVNHTIGAPNFNARIVIFDGVSGNVDYDSGPGMQNNYNVAGFNWTTSQGSNINTGLNALHDLDNDGIFELAYNLNGQTNEVVGLVNGVLTVRWSVNSLGTYVLIGAENMDTDPDKELVFLNHSIGAVNFNPRITIFDGATGNVDYDTGPGMQNNYNVAGFNWTTSQGFNINTGFSALHDVDNDGVFELVYNRNGQANEVLGLVNNVLGIRWSVNSGNTYVLVGAENMDMDQAKELVFADYTSVIGPMQPITFIPRITIFDGGTGNVEYDTGPAMQNNYNIPGFNFTGTLGSNVNAGFNGLHDIDGDGLFELIYNFNGLVNEVVGWLGNNLGIRWSVNALNTYVLIGVAQMDMDPDKELVFANHTIGPVNVNARIVIFDGASGTIDYDTGPGMFNNYNIAGFNWTTSQGSNINTGLNALHDLDNDGVFELAYNLNNQLNEVVGLVNNILGIKWSVNNNNTYVLIGAEQMDNDPAKELVFVNHTIGNPNFNARIVIFDGVSGNVDFDTGPGMANNYNIAGFNWTTTQGSNINTGKRALIDVDNNGRYELAFNFNGTDNKLVGWSLISSVSDPTRQNTFRANLYPNPAIEQLQLEWACTEKLDLQIKIYNSLGQEVYSIPQNTYLPGKHIQTIYLNQMGMNAGRYYCTFIDAAGGTVVRSFVKTE